MAEDRWFLRFDRPCRGGDTIVLSDEFLALRQEYDFDARFLRLAPLQDFLIFKGPDGPMDDFWFPVIAGLKTTRGLLGNYRQSIATGPAADESRRMRREGRLREKIAPLEILESLLLEGQQVGAQFFLAERVSY